MNCNVKGCPGQYEEKRVLQAEEVDGQVVVVRNVPAQVCGFCGDVLTTWDTMAQVAAFLETNPQPAGAAPIYEFVPQWMPKPLDEEPIGSARVRENGR